MVAAAAPAPRARTGSTAARAAIWLGIYLAAVTVPLFALLPDADSTGRGFWRDFSLALGYAALAMFGVSFALTARFRRATAPFGIDIVYYFHRYLALLALAIAAAHYLILRIANPAALGAADPRIAPAYMSAGRIALLLFVVIVTLALARRVLRFEYDRWRISHAALATTAVALSIWHLLGAGNLLDRPWKQALWAAYGLFWLALLVWVRLIRPWRLAQRPWRVTAVRPERGRVHTLVLAPPADARLSFAPGQFAWLTLRASPFAMREHPFSIASSAHRPRGDEPIELSIKALGDFTATIKDVRTGETAYVDAPYGNFTCDAYPHAQRFVFVAGGIGSAPFMSMLRTAADRNDRRAFVLFYGNRSWERVAFREELERLGQRLDLRVVHVLQEPPADWRGERGFVTRELLARHLPLDEARVEYFLCGPTPMTSSVEKALASLGVPAARIHSEIFDWV
jgi:predicted ferric reductase